MHLLIKWYYWYKNLGDELILFQLLNRAEDRFNPKKITIECWNKEWLEERIITHKYFLIPWIIQKLEFTPKPNLQEKIQICLWKNRWLYDLIILWWWEVIDESRSFLYRWRNHFFQYFRSIKHWRTALVWWIWTNKKFWTSFLQKFLVRNSVFSLIRDKSSFELVKKIIENNREKLENKAEYIWDLTYSLLEETADIFKQEKITSKRNPYFLVNISPLCDIQKSLKSIKEFSDSHKNLQPIYIPCSDEDKSLYNNVLQILPNCEIFDRTKSNISEILKLFYFSKAWIWARLHFLYILKFFKKEIKNLHYSHKIETNLSDLDN